jgi:hypothetical protein
MNRGTVVFLALAILLAHAFAIHQTPDGDFGAPYEFAHVAYRLGRNFVYDGVARWNPAGPPADSYPSLAWIGLSALAARAYVYPTLVAQGVDLVCALVTVVVLAQFSAKRTAGLIAPTLLALSGSAAAASLSGTEAALAMLLVTSSFLAFERGWPRVLAGSTALLVLTRPEGTPVVLALFVLEFVVRLRGEHARRARLARALLAPLVVLALVLLLRLRSSGTLLSSFAAPLLELDVERWRLGGLWLASFVSASGFALLVLAVVLSVFAARLSAMGGRALVLVVVWCLVLAASGGDAQPFWISLVPVLPLFFLVVQESLREWMDQDPRLEKVVWPVLFLSAFAALAASKVPGDIGPLKLEAPLTSWQTPRGTLAASYPRPFGRLGLLEEIRAVEHLRTLGVFLSDRVADDAVIGTQWPGAIGYLSRKEVLDLSGRVSQLPGQVRTNSWNGSPKIDVVAAVKGQVDYLVPVLGTLSDSAAPSDFLRQWLERQDVVGGTDERVRQLSRALIDFELVCVPVPLRSSRPHEPSERPFPLLQHRSRSVAPELELARDGTRISVRVRHRGHQQVVDLCVQWTAADGTTSFLRPTGGFEEREALDARTSLLLYPTATRPIELVTLTPPASAGKLRAWLHNPGMRPEAPLAAVGEAVTLEL